MPRVFVTRSIPDAGLGLLRSAADVDVFTGDIAPDRNQLLENIRGCDGLLCMLSDKIDADVFEAAGPQLKVVANYAVGYNNIDLEEAKARKVSVGNTPDVLTDATADIAVGLMMAAARCFKQGMRDAEQGRWQTWEPLGWIGQDLVGRTVGIVGMGRIGQAVAKRLHGGWGMRVLYTARSDKPEVDMALGAQRVELDDLLSHSDFVSLHVPLTAATAGLLGPRELGLLKPHAVIVNTARGDVIDQAALVSALRERRIFAAGLDVSTPEPLPLNHPLLRLDNCVMLPHVGSATVDTRDAMAERAAANVLAGLAGEPLPYSVM